MKTTDLSEISFRAYPVKPGVNARYREWAITGFDTETAPSGECVLIADSNGRHKIVHELTEVIEFLMYKKNRRSINFFYNLEFDINSILALMSRRNQVEIAHRGFTIIDDRKIQIISRKMLCISRLTKDSKFKHPVKFFDISQFYKTKGLELTYEKTFGKPYKKKLDASVHEFSTDSISADDIQYCVEDAQACQRLSVNLVEATHKIAPMRNYYSGASISKSVRKHYMTRPYMFRPTRLQQFALWSFNGGRIEIIQRGFFEKAYIYDIISAYPSVQCELDDIGREYTKNSEYEPDSLHSFFRCDVWVDDCVVSPIKYLRNDLLIYPKGCLKDVYLSKDELELLMDYDIRFTIKRAVHNWGEVDKPFAYMRDLFKKRLKYKDAGNPLELPLKLALNSAYGICIERIPRSELIPYSIEYETDPRYKPIFINGEIKLVKKRMWAGMFFNPCFASEITSKIRCKLYRDCIKHEDHVIKFSTDSIAFDKKVKLDFKHHLGAYEESPEYRGLVLGNGVYSFESGGKRVVKFRGFDSKIDVRQLAEDNPGLTSCTVTRHAPVKLKESLKIGVYEGKLNQFIDKVKYVDINFDNKRLWERDAENFGDLLHNIIHSKPLSI